MMPSSRRAIDHVYVVKLRVPPMGHGAPLAGRIEHVASGCRLEFEDAAGLLACLRQVQPCTPVAQAPTAR